MDKESKFKVQNYNQPNFKCTTHFTHLETNVYKQIPNWNYTTILKGNLKVSFLNQLACDFIKSRKIEADICVGDFVIL